jgi:hypothetical protein
MGKEERRFGGIKSVKMTEKPRLGSHLLVPLLSLVNLRTKNLAERILSETAPVIH